MDSMLQQKVSNLSSRLPAIAVRLSARSLASSLERTQEEEGDIERERVRGRKRKKEKNHPWASAGR